MLKKPEEQTLTQHLSELRNRLIYCLVAILLIFLACYHFSQNIYDFLLQPLLEIIGDGEGKRMIYTSLTEGFTTYLKLSFVSALFFAFPFIAIQFYLFIAPALYKKEKKFILAILIASPLLFLAGTIMVYEMILPLAFKFFVSFQNLNPINSLPIELEAKIGEYLSLVMQMVFAFGIAFQLPILLICLVKFGILSVESLRKKRRYWIVIIFAIAAVITPPDAISQIALAIPMILLYEISILISSKITKNNDK
ncbi:MAG: sec-independent protein translocase protein TatC [Rickettsiales bacterium]|jgi:sec-independent protein translocase protein TatC